MFNWQLIATDYHYIWYMFHSFQSNNWHVEIFDLFKTVGFCSLLKFCCLNWFFKLTVSFHVARLPWNDSRILNNWNNGISHQNIVVWSYCTFKLKKMWKVNYWQIYDTWFRYFRLFFYWQEKVELFILLLSYLKIYNYSNLFMW